MMIEHDRHSYMCVARVLLVVNPATQSLIPAGPVPTGADPENWGASCLADWMQREAEKAIAENTKKDDFCEAGYWSTFGVHLSFGHTCGKKDLPVYAKAALAHHVLDETLRHINKRKN